MVQAIRVHETGSAEVLTWEHVELGEPGPGEARIRHTAIGLNFIDTYFRSGLYPAPDGVPFIPGNEGAGIVQTVGEGVSHIKPGDRVAYVGPLGAYAQERIIPADRLVVIPDGIDDKAAAGMMLKGMTAQYLLRQTFNVGPETTLLFHAAAGGVGLIAGQWAAHLGATVIGTAGSQEKVDLAKANGYQDVINYRTENFVERVKEITGGKGCDVVYDSVGKDTYPGSLDCLKPRGLWVSFGQSSGPIQDFNLALLAQKGSLFATRPTLFSYIATREQLETTSGDLFDVVAKGIVKIAVNQEYRLADAVQAHTDLEGRKTTGTTVLIP
ncbi:quinone oxidoreductase family protein [Roseibium alexandrii]|uniref:NADPH:quinone reductase n=1 Tax=Roseibium alexandrii (strain DSM 17067 / NCIMB 14079 / DFL-11) TaxID=244592 RepID=A0A5E8GWD9_ROSAD|nr:quinone oxidoreductase [Roseibium alexandrii]EEE43928.1 NADPH:quinone reductase [Roseibium alexandrii DFL-11]